jgi:hypothetical protein
VGDVVGEGGGRGGEVTIVLLDAGCERRFGGRPRFLGGGGGGGDVGVDGADLTERPGSGVTVGGDESGKLDRSDLRRSPLSFPFSPRTGGLSHPNTRVLVRDWIDRQVTRGRRKKNWITHRVFPILLRLPIPVLLLVSILFSSLTTPSDRLLRRRYHADLALSRHR